MKALKHNENFIAFFRDSTTLEDAELWIILNDPSKLLKLNEWHSCLVSNDGKQIFVSGDEDSITLDFIDIIPVN